VIRGPNTGVNLTVARLQASRGEYPIDGPALIQQPACRARADVGQSHGISKATVL
jgi:hypothetical protein